MVVFDELRITNDGEYLIIDARVRKEQIYKDVSLTKLIIGTHKTYAEGATNGVEIDITGSINEEERNKSRRIFVKLSNMDLNMNHTENTEEYIDLKNDLIYVYVETTPLDTDCPSLPCDMMQTLNIGVTMYMGNVYNTFMNYMKELSESECRPCDNMPRGLIDLILRYTALTTAIDSKHFIKANEFFNKWFAKNKITNPNLNCGCNG